jgi:hypothetical protein
VTRSSSHSRARNSGPSTTSPRTDLSSSRRARRRVTTIFWPKHGRRPTTRRASWGGSCRTRLYPDRLSAVSGFLTRAEARRLYPCHFNTIAFTSRRMLSSSWKSRPSNQRPSCMSPCSTVSFSPISPRHSLGVRVKASRAPTSSSRAADRPSPESTWHRRCASRYATMLALNGIIR